VYTRNLQFEDIRNHWHLRESGRAAIRANAIASAISAVRTSAQVSYAKIAPIWNFKLERRSLSALNVASIQFVLAD
jgi:hypothetical protein